LSTDVVVRGSSADHIRGFDGIRGIAVLLVIAFHCWRDVRAFAPVSKAWMVLEMGWVGVDVFFALSGFLITGILLRVRGRPGWWPRFMTRRAMRIMPLYFAVLAILLVPRWFVLGELPEIPTWSLLLFVSNWFLAYQPNTEQVYAVTWSLSVEEQFYVIWPLVVGSVRSPRALKAILVVILLASPLTRFWVHDPLNRAAWMLTPCKADALAAGALWAVLAWEGRAVPRWAPAVLAGWTMLLLAGGAAGLYALTDPWFAVAGLSIIAFGCALWVATVASTQEGLVVRVLEWGPLAAVGRISYGVYLLHAVFVAPLAVGARSFGLPPDLQLAATLVLAPAVTIAAAALTWRTLEQPILRLKDRWT
jgi:peptidoglycan/LPS O-acetylase OafA/YrhL